MNRHIIYKTQHLALLCKIRNTLVKYVADRVADVAEVASGGDWRNLVYALVLGTSGATLISSSLISPTTSRKITNTTAKNFLQYIDCRVSATNDWSSWIRASHLGCVGLYACVAFRMRMTVCLRGI